MSAFVAAGVNLLALVTLLDHLWTVSLPVLLLLLGALKNAAAILAIESSCKNKHD